jgi:hypothetical protein
MAALIDFRVDDFYEELEVVKKMKIGLKFERKTDKRGVSF